MQDSDHLTSAGPSEDLPAALPGWQPIETAPKDRAILVYGYNRVGSASPSGPHNLYKVTVGSIDGMGACDDLLEPGCDCVYGKTVDHPTHWMHLPAPPKDGDPAQGVMG